MQFNIVNNPSLHFDVPSDPIVAPQKVHGHDGYAIAAHLRVNQPDKFEAHVKITLTFDNGTKTQQRVWFSNHSRRKPWKGKQLGPYEVGKVYEGAFHFAMALSDGNGGDMPLTAVEVETIA